MPRAKKPIAVHTGKPNPCWCGHDPVLCYRVHKEQGFWWCGHGGEGKEHGDISGPNNDPYGVGWNKMLATMYDRGYATRVQELMVGTVEPVTVKPVTMKRKTA